MSGGGCPLSLAPPAAHVELERFERFGADEYSPLVCGCRDPTATDQAVDLERPCERIDEPEMSDPFARVDRHLAVAVERAGAGGERLAGPVRSLLEPGDVREFGHVLAPPARKIRDEDIVAEVQLGLVQDPPAARLPCRARRLVEGAQVHAHRRGGERVGRGGPGARDQLAVDELGHQVLGSLDDVLVGGPPSRGAHRASIPWRARRTMPGRGIERVITGASLFHWSPAPSACYL